MDPSSHQGTHLPIQYSNNYDLKQDNLEDLLMEEQSQSVYGEWYSHWQSEVAKNK